jgi:hypothetical protein
MSLTHGINPLRYAKLSNAENSRIPTNPSPFR